MNLTQMFIMMNQAESAQVKADLAEFIPKLATEIAARGFTATVQKSSAVPVENSLGVSGDDYVIGVAEIPGYLKVFSNVTNCSDFEKDPAAQAKQLISNAYFHSQVVGTLTGTPPVPEPPPTPVKAGV